MPAAIPMADRLRAHSTFDLQTRCWLWTGCIDKCGYGKIGSHGSGESLAHRASYKYYVGEIPEGCEIDHLCRVRRCINPEHLRAVPHAVNVAAGIYKTANHRNSRKLVCKRGHPLQGENLMFKKSAGKITRQCRICVKERGRERLKKRTAEILASDPVGYRAAIAAKRRAQRARKRLMKAIHGIEVREV